MATAPVFPATLVNSSQIVNNANGTSTVTIFTAGGNGTRIDSISATSTDSTLAHDVQILSGGNLIGTVSVAISAGTTSALPAKNVLSDSNLTLPITDPYGNKVIYLAAGQTLQVAMAVTITSGKQVVFTVMGGSY